MKWLSADSGKLPRDREQVVVKVREVYYVTVYYAEKRIFKAEEELRETFFRVGEPELFWTRSLAIENVQMFVKKVLAEIVT